jgi:hypothetical protein
LETVKILGWGKVGIRTFKSDMHSFVQRNGLYPTMYRLLKVSQPHFTRPADLYRFMFDRKMCPDFLTAVLRTVESGTPYLDVMNKEVSRFDLHVLVTLSNRVHRQPACDKERARWSVHNTIFKELYNEGIPARDRIKSLVDMGIIELSDWPVPTYPKHLPGLEPKPVILEPEEPAPKKPVQLSLTDLFMPSSRKTLLDLMGDPVEKK